MLFQKCGYLVGPENRIFRKLISGDPKKKALTTEMNFCSYFHFKWIPEREREREKNALTELQSAPFASTSAVDRDLRSWSHAVDRDLAFAPTIAISSSRRSFSEIASSIMISPSRRSRSCEAARCFARSDRRRGRQTGTCKAPRHRTQSSVKRQASIWGLFVLFWICLFLLLFQTLENIFQKICENATKHMKTFSFPKNSIFGKWNIFRKCFYTNRTQPKFQRRFL